MSNSNTNLQTQTSSVIQNDTVSSCSISNIHERVHNFQEVMPAQVLKKSVLLIKFLSETLQDYGTMPIFKRTFSQDLDLLEQHLTKDVLSRIDCTTTLTNLRTKFENAFNSEFEERMRKYTRYNAQSFNDAMIFVKQNSCSDKEDSNSETLSIQQISKGMLLEFLKTQDFISKSNTICQKTKENAVALGQTTNHGKMTSSSSGMIQKLMMHISDPFNDKESNAEVQLTAECNIFFYGQPHNLATEIIVEVGLTRKLFDSCTSKVDSEPPHCSNVDITNIHECKQTLDVSAGTSINVQKEQSLDLSADDDTEKWRQITSVLTPVHNVNRSSSSS
ncbi:hypothetical protein Tco_1483617 [Tanacetum coccineum]